MRTTSLAATVMTVALAGIPLSSVAPALRAAGQQNNQQAPQAPGTVKVQTSLVNVFATVRDKHNGIIADLTKDDFKVFEDGVEQKVVFFAKETGAKSSRVELHFNNAKPEEIAEVWQVIEDCARK